MPGPRSPRRSDRAAARARVAEPARAHRPDRDDPVAAAGGVQRAAADRLGEAGAGQRPPAAAQPHAISCWSPRRARSATCCRRSSPPSCCGCCSRAREAPGSPGTGLCTRSSCINLLLAVFNMIPDSAARRRQRAGRSAAAHGAESSDRVPAAVRVPRALRADAHRRAERDHRAADSASFRGFSLP